MRLISPRISHLFIVGCLFVIAAGCGAEHQAHPETSSENARTYEAVGVVKSITDSKKYVNIDHEAIPGFMDAMTMFFSIQDTSILGSIAIEDSVAFTIEENAGAVHISKISTIP